MKTAKSPAVLKKQLNQKLRDVSNDFVGRHGSMVFLDVCQGVINKILVKKGIATVEELRDAYLEDIENVDRVLKYSASKKLKA